MRFGISIILGVAACAAACSNDSSGDGWNTGPYLPPPASAPAPERAHGPRPNLGATVRQSDAPPPLSGGTILVTKDRSRAVAADSDRDRVAIVDLVKRQVERIVPLALHDEPGRLVESADHHIHVVLRRSGAVATIDLASGGLLAKRPVCGSPRGIAVDEARARLLTVCEGGEVMALPLDHDAPAALLVRTDRDLRDVVVSHGRIFVSRFRSAEVVELDAAGKLLWRTKPSAVEAEATPSSSSSKARSRVEPMVAFRMVAAPDDDPEDGPILVHEEGRDGLLPATPTGYYGDPPPPANISDPCGGDSVVLSALSRIGPTSWTLHLPVQAVLPVDVALDGKTMAVVAAGNGHTHELPQVFLLAPPSGPPSSWTPCGGTITALYPSGQVVAIAALGKGDFVVQSRQPSQIEILTSDNRTIVLLPGDSREDTGHAIFHANSGVGLACASCHPEGADDGRVWNFGEDQLRTPSLRGTLAQTAPYHWSGDIADIQHLAKTVLGERMNGPELDAVQAMALESWLFALPAPVPSPRADAASIARGKVLFERADLACVSCHSGTQRTNSQTVDVGTGGKFQVPSLVGLAARAPFLHDGCAPTLEARFGPCGGKNHGFASSMLVASEVADLVGYLETF